MIAPCIAKETQVSDEHHSLWLEIHSQVQLLEKALDYLQHVDEAAYVPVVHVLHLLLRNPLPRLGQRGACADGAVEHVAVSDVDLREVLQCLWSAFLDASKTVEISAATVHLALHPEFFQVRWTYHLLRMRRMGHAHGFMCQRDLEDGDALHEDGGPVNWIAAQLLDFGRLSPRVLMMTTMRLLEALQRNPERIRCYLPHLTRIILHDAKDKGCPDIESKVQHKCMDR